MAWTPQSELANVVEFAGFHYDPGKDIIYSRMNPLQRLGGYSLLYDDVAAVTISSIIDCEPIYFSYGGRDWLIEFWKGQYGIETGAEIGVYAIEPGNKINKAIDRVTDYLPGSDNPIIRKVIESRNYDFYKCVGDADLLEMSFILSRNGQTLFGRGPEKHWWLTGFKWGIVSDPGELAVRMRIRFPNKEMCKAFKGGLRRALYFCLCDSSDTVVNLTFACPHYFPQPVGRYALKKSVMENNRNNVDMYNELKRQLGLTNNDPNGFKTADIDRLNLRPFYDKVLGHFTAWKTEAEKIKKLWDDQIGG